MNFPGLFDKLVDAGLPVSSATDDGAVTFGAMLTNEQERLYGELLLFYQPEKYMQYLSSVVQAHLDKTVNERGYSSMMAACTYASSKKAKWKSEAIACVDWRDAVWEKAIAIMDDCKLGKRDIPTASDLLAELPAMVWPDDG